MHRIIILIILALMTSSCIGRIAGASKLRDLNQLSPGARALMDKALEGIPKGELLDAHVHAMGLPECGNGNYVNPKMRTWWHPIRRYKFACYKSAAGVRSHKNADSEYIERLLALRVSHFGKMHILAIDKYHREDGQPELEQTPFHVPSSYVYKLSQTHPGHFEPVISIHPYREDAIPTLREWQARGIRYVKWLPNAMNIAPRHPKTVSFCREMLKHDMVLLTHVGHEDAVHSEELQHLGNPLLWRSVLDTGLKIIMAHAASTGESKDLESPGAPIVSNFSLFGRLMDDPKYRGNLFGDISAVTQFNRDPSVLKTLLDRKDWHPRLINGSDYPLPAINFLIQTRKLEKLGFITKEERGWLNEIYDCNPLLFDIVLKRTIRHPENGKRLSSSIFILPKGLRQRLK